MRRKRHDGNEARRDEELKTYVHGRSATGSSQKPTGEWTIRNVTTLPLATRTPGGHVRYACLGRSACAPYAAERP